MLGACAMLETCASCDNVTRPNLQDRRGTATERRTYYVIEDYIQTKPCYSSCPRWAPRNNIEQTPPLHAVRRLSSSNTPNSQRQRRPATRPNRLFFLTSRDEPETVMKKVRIAWRQCNTKDTVRRFHAQAQRESTRRAKISIIK